MIRRLRRLRSHLDAGLRYMRLVSSLAEVTGMPASELHEEFRGVAAKHAHMTPLLAADEARMSVMGGAGLEGVWWRSGVVCCGDAVGVFCDGDNHAYVCERAREAPN